MTYNTLAHVATGDLATAVLHNNLLDNVAIQKLSIDDGGNLSTINRTNLTMTANVAGAITPTQNWHAVDTFSAAATGNLATITIAGNVRPGHLLLLNAANSAHVVTVQHNIGNIQLSGGDYVLDGNFVAVLLLQLIGTTWFEVSRANYALEGASRTETGTGSITALALPSGSGPLTIYMANASNATIKGIAAGRLNQTLKIISIGAGYVHCSHNDGAAAAGTKLDNFVTVGFTTAYFGIGWFLYIYDSSNRWRLLDHEQGAPIQQGVTGSYSTSNVTSGGGGSVSTTTVDECSHYVKGRLLTMSFRVAVVSITGATATTIAIVVPGGGGGGGGGYQAAETRFYPRIVRYSNGGTVDAGMIQTGAGSGSINIWTHPNGAGWVVTGPATYFEFAVTFPIL